MRLPPALRSLPFLAGAAILLFWLCCAALGSLVVPYDPYHDDLMNTLAPPSAAHWFGTDQLGRDVFSRVLVGARCRTVQRVDHDQPVAPAGVRNNRAQIRDIRRAAQVEGLRNESQPVRQRPAVMLAPCLYALA